MNRKAITLEIHDDKRLVIIKQPQPDNRDTRCLDDELIVTAYLLVSLYMPVPNGDKPASMQAKQAWLLTHLHFLGMEDGELYEEVKSISRTTFSRYMQLVHNATLLYSEIPAATVFGEYVYHHQDFLRTLLSQDRTNRAGYTRNAWYYQAIGYRSSNFVPDVEYPSATSTTAVSKGVLATLAKRCVTLVKSLRPNY